MRFRSHFQLAGLLMCCWLSGNTALAQTPEPTAIKYPDANASPAVKAAFTQALEKCQTEFREDYDRKMAKAVADGKPHLVPVFERLRDRHLVELCQMRAEIAVGEARIVAGEARIVVNEALTGLFSDTKRLVDKITSNTETPKDIADLQRTHQALKDMNTARPDAGALRVIQLLDGLLAKYKRVQ